MPPEALHVRAAAALSRGDPLGALNAVGADEKPHSRAVRGLALAQLHELEAAHRELRAAADRLGDEPLYRARALAALAEIAAARRQIGTALDELADAADRLTAANDPRNAAWARLVRARIVLLAGSIAEAKAEIDVVSSAMPRDAVAVQTALELVRATAAARELRSDEALAALDDAIGALADDEHPLLAGELAEHRRAFREPLAALTVAGREASLSLPELGVVFRARGESPEPLADFRRWLIVDAIALRAGFPGEDLADLQTRRIPHALLVELARAWPQPVSADDLIRRVFDGTDDESYHERCRVEIGRLRELLPADVSVEACGRAWRLRAPDGCAVALVEPSSRHSALTALLADGHDWAARDLALAIGASQRSIQRALRELADSGDVESVGRARAQRWRSRDSRLGIASQMFLLSLLRPP